MKSSIFTYALALLGMLAVSGCASTSAGLRVETAGSGHGALGQPHVFVSGSKLYVSGDMKHRLGHTPPMAAHVDIQLIDRHGRVIAEKRDAIRSHHPRQDHRHMRRHGYAASFPAEVARQAVTVRIVYHAKRHS